MRFHSFASIILCLPLTANQGASPGKPTAQRRILHDSKRYGEFLFKAYQLKGKGKPAQNLRGLIERLERSNEGRFEVVQATEFLTKSQREKEDFNDGYLRWGLGFVAFSAEKRRVWFTSTVDERTPNSTKHLYAWDSSHPRVADLGEFHGTSFTAWPSTSGQYLLICETVRFSQPNVTWWLVDSDGCKYRELASTEDMTDRYRWLPGDLLADKDSGNAGDGLIRYKGRIDVSRISMGWKPSIN